MVAFQEEAHYGETAGVQLGNYDAVKFAESFGCEGYSVTSPDQLPELFKKAFAAQVPVIIHVPVDYSLNERLMQGVIQSFIS